MIPLSLSETFHDFVMNIYGLGEMFNQLYRLYIIQILDGGESTIQFTGRRKAIMDEAKPRILSCICPWSWSNLFILRFERGGGRQKQKMASHLITKDGPLPPQVKEN